MSELKKTFLIKEADVRAPVSRQQASKTKYGNELQYLVKKVLAACDLPDPRAAGSEVNRLATEFDLTLSKLAQDLTQ